MALIPNIIFTQQQLKDKTSQERIEFFSNDNNLLFKGDSTAEIIFDKITIEKKHEILIKDFDLTNKDNLAVIWEKCWLFASEENHEKLFYFSDAGGENADFEKLQESWNLALKEYRKEIPNICIDDAIKNKIEHSANLRDAFSVKQDFLTIFNKKSFENEIIGECYFYSFVMMLLRKKKVMIESNNTMEDKLIMPLSVFWISESGSGKDIALDFMQELIEIMNDELRKQGLDDLRIKYENLSGGETPEVYFSRPRMTKTGSIKFIEGNIDIIQGKLERNDILFVRECSFLFRLKGTERQNILEILLQALEGRTITKELTGWDGNVIPTKANCAYIGVSRPVKEVQEVVAGSGLLQRGLFWGRELSREDHERMDDAIAYKEIGKEEYRNNFLNLAQLMVEFYKSVNPATFKMKNSIVGKELIRQYKKEKRNFIYDGLQNAFTQETLNTFINRIDETCVKLSYVNCYARGGSMPDETDVQSSLKLLDRIFTQLITWLESNSIKVTQEELNLTYRAGKFFESKQVIKRAELVKFIIKARGCSYPTALKMVDRMFVGTNKLFSTTKDNMLVKN